MFRDHSRAGHARIAITIHKVDVTFEENVPDVPAAAHQGQGEANENPSQAKGRFHEWDKTGQIIGSASTYCGVALLPPQFLGESSFF
jgi:acyl-CoA hydrolase